MLSEFMGGNKECQLTIRMILTSLVEMLRDPLLMTALAISDGSNIIFQKPCAIKGTARQQRAHDVILYIHSRRRCDRGSSMLRF